ncbi:MFS transporter [Actinoplanes sp. NPDC000266]
MRQSPALAALSLGTLAYALAQTTVLPALPALAATLHTDRPNVTWTLTAYLIASAVLTPVLSRLGDLYGRRRLLVAALTLFAAGSGLSALGTGLGVVVAGRVLQGAGGAVIPLGVAVARATFPPERRGRAIGLISTVFGVGSGLGLILGGLVVDHAPLAWIFWSTAIPAAVAAIAVRFLLPGSDRTAGGRVDLTGALLLGAGITLPLLAVGRGSVWGWTSGLTLGLIAAGVAVLAVLVLVERRLAHPLIDLGLLARPAVLVTNLATFLVGGGMFGAFVLVPQLAAGQGLSATRAGLLLLPGSLAMMAGGPLAAKLHLRHGGRVPLALAAAVTALGSLLLAVDHGNQVAVAAWSLLALFGVGVALAVIPAVVVEAVPAARAAETAGVNSLIRSAGSSVGTQIMAGILAAGLAAGAHSPSSGAYSAAFVFCAVAALAAAAVATRVPRVNPAHAAPVAAGVASERTSA